MYTGETFFCQKGGYQQCNNFSVSPSIILSKRGTFHKYYIIYKTTHKSNSNFLCRQTGIKNSYRTVQYLGNSFSYPTKLSFFEKILMLKCSRIYLRSFFKQELDYTCICTPLGALFHISSRRIFRIKECIYFSQINFHHVHEPPN